MILKEIDGDILNMPVDVIVQQSNCLSVKPLGLSRSIADKMDIDIYKNRRCLKIEKNLAIKEDRDFPGRCRLVKNKSTYPPKYVANILGQFAPGGPGKYYKYITKYHGYKDDRLERLKWFKQGLESLSEIIRAEKFKTIAFPKYIGCGLGGGKWEDYYHLIFNFALKSGCIVYIVNFSGEIDNSP